MLYLKTLKINQTFYPAINDLLTSKTVTRRVESIGQNLVEILKQDINECVYFSFQ